MKKVVALLSAEEISQIAPAVAWCAAAAKAEEVENLLKAYLRRVKDDDPERSILEARYLYWKNWHDEVAEELTRINSAALDSVVDVDRNKLYLVAVHAELLLKHHKGVSSKDKGLTEAKQVAEANKQSWKGYLQPGETDDADVKMSNGKTFMDYAYEKGVFATHK